MIGADGVAVNARVEGRWIETVATRLDGADERVVTMRDISRQRALDEAKDLFLATTSRRGCRRWPRSRNERTRSSH